jgi:hypothetical protein
MVKNRKHTLITIGKKLEIIELISKGVCKKSIAQEFGIATSTVFQIYQKRDLIQKYTESFQSPTSLEKVSIMHQPSYSPSLEIRLKAWYDSQIEKKITVTGDMILNEAQELQRILEYEEGKKYDFHFTMSFVNTFKKKFCLIKSSEFSLHTQKNLKIREKNENFVKMEDFEHDIRVKTEISHDDGLEALRVFAEYSKQHAGFGTITLDLLNHLKNMTEMIKTNQVKLSQFESILSKK